MCQPSTHSPSPAQSSAIAITAHVAQSSSPQVSPSSPSPRSALRIPHSPNPQFLHAHGLALFRTIFSLVLTLFNSLVRFYQAHPEHDALRTLTLSIECLTALLSLEFTLHRAPERITPRQLLRLSKAARILTRLTGQSFDFTPWISLSASELSDLDALYPPPTNPYAEHRPRLHELRLPSAGSSSVSLRLYPGATLANVIKKLARILPPDFSPETFLSPADVVLESPSPSPSCSQSEVESQSQSIPSIGSIPPVAKSPSPQVSLSAPVAKSPSPQVPPSSSVAPAPHPPP